MTQKYIYADYAATTLVDPIVLRSMLPYFSKNFANTASLHTPGQMANSVLEKCRADIAALINAGPNEIIFTGSATESNNMVLKSIALAHPDGHIIVSSIEHDCILESARFVERQGLSVTYLPVDKYGMVDVVNFKKAITSTTVLASVMHANNEIGTINPIKELAAICHQNNIIFHTDASQTFGKIPLDVQDLNVDLLTASSHKIYGPKGAAFLYVKKGINITPFIHGGGHERGLRSSTVNLPSIVGFAKAASLSYKKMSTETPRLIELRDYLIKNVLALIPTASLTGHPTQRLPNLASFCFSHIEGESIVALLDSYGIGVSTGSACSSPKLQPSHVLTACGLPQHQIHGSIRISLGRFTKKSDVDYIINTLPLVVNRLNKISPFSQNYVHT
jgi:cysteine desulfurase